MITWSQVMNERWDWSEAALSRVHRTFLGDKAESERPPARIMVVGDTQTGKTTLLLRLLGIAEHEHSSEIKRVLRAGRAHGESSTSAPIRYRWSSEDERWSLAQPGASEPELVSAQDLVTQLAAYRAPDRTLWRADQSPLEVGLPTRFSPDPSARRNLRILDLPGIGARLREERILAHSLIARFVPYMNRILFVTVANAPTFFEDPLISESPYLKHWASRPGRFGVVLTRAFSPDSRIDGLRRLVEQSDPHDIERLAQRFREGFTSAVIAEGSPIPGSFSDHVFPVEMADWWTAFEEGHPDLAGRCRPINEWILENLAQVIRDAETEASHYLAAPELAREEGKRIRAEMDRRSMTLTRYTQKIKETSGGREEKRDQLDGALDELREQSERLKSAEGAVSRFFVEGSVEHEAPKAPAPLKGITVRALQEPDREDWWEATVGAWERWRSKLPAHVKNAVASFPPLRETELRSQYSALLDCCNQCERRRFWKKGQVNQPEYCYQKIKGLERPLSEWVVGQLRSAATVSLNSIRAEVKGAEREVKRQAAGVEKIEAEIGKLERELREASRVEEAERRLDEECLSLISSFNSVLVEENGRQVRVLLTAMADADVEDQAWYGVAVARALLDLKQTLGSK